MFEVKTSRLPEKLAVSLRGDQAELKSVQKQSPSLKFKKSKVG
jgi:hypothetical protein